MVEVEDKSFLSSVSDDERLTMYEDFAKTSRGEMSLQSCLIEDLKVLEITLKGPSLIVPSAPKCFSRHFTFHRKYVCFE